MKVATGNSVASLAHRARNDRTMNHRITDLPEPSPRFCAPLPRGLRDDAQAMSWSAFTARYSLSASG
jgi:hypothetical protein